MKLSDLLDESAVVLDVGGVDKWSLLESLTDVLVRTHQVEARHRDEVHAALVARERSMTTGMERGIALPHTSVEVVEEPALALGIAPDGIEFEAIDGHPTYLVILLVTARHRTKAHIRTLAEIARLLSSAELRTSLMRASSAREVLETIRSAEAAVA